ncbi:cytochrome P450 monooxygenase family 51 (sterol 14-demethylase) [Fusarium sp. NRRL 52700]|nr:cytochrome P450 monooxygenase family 51 (sterol 14-demethylase) [Fusarium sp. NRRL 52700]
MRQQSNVFGITVTLLCGEKRVINPKKIQQSHFSDDSGHGDVFTFILFGRKIVACLGVDGNDFVLNSRIQDANAEEIYSPLTTPVFGSDVVYDCTNSKLMEQKKSVKFGLTQKALESHVQLIEQEVLEYIQAVPPFSGKSGTVDVSKAMAEITIFTAARSLQGEEVRRKLTAELAALYHDLDLGFTPMREIYMGIINERRRGGGDLEKGTDMIANLMNCEYKNGQPIPDKEIAHMMITLLMAGQHSSSSASSWVILHLASSPDIAGELCQEQVINLSTGGVLPPLQYSDLDKLPLLQNVVKETLRAHSNIHSILRKIKRPVQAPGSPCTITTDKVLLASPTPQEEAVADEVIDYGYGAVSNGTKSPYLPFGAGRYRCIGEKFAYVNLGVIVATLVRDFRLSTLDGKPGIPATDYTSLFSRPVQPAYIKWERRKA